MKAYNWVVVYFDDDIIQCTDIFDDYLKAVGAAYTSFLDAVNEMIADNGYELVSKTEFYELECSTGFGWSATLKRKDYEFTLTYYLLKKENKDE